MQSNGTETVSLNWTRYTPWRSLTAAVPLSKRDSEVLAACHVNCRADCRLRTMPRFTIEAPLSSIVVDGCGSQGSRNKEVFQNFIYRVWRYLALYLPYILTGTCITAHESRHMMSGRVQLDGEDTQVDVLA